MITNERQEIADDGTNDLSEVARMRLRQQQMGAWAPDGDGGPGSPPPLPIESQTNAQAPGAPATPAVPTPPALPSVTRLPGSAPMPVLKTATPVAGGQTVGGTQRSDNPADHPGYSPPGTVGAPPPMASPARPGLAGGGSSFRRRPGMAPTPAPVPLTPAPPGSMHTTFAPPALPPAPAAATPPTGGPGVGVNRIDPGNDLRSTQVVAEDDPRTTSYASKVDQAAGSLPTNRVNRARQIADDTYGSYGNTDVSEGPDVSADRSARLNKYGGMVDENAGKLAAVDRFELAKQKLAEFRASTAPDYEQDLRKATELSARMGQGRSGIQRTRYGDIALDRERSIRDQESRLLTDALEGTIGDQFNKTNTLAGLESGLAGEERAVRGEARGERDFKTGVRTGNVNRRLQSRDAANATGERLAGAESADAYNNLGALAGLEEGARANTRNRADQIRGERDYENQQEQKSFERGVLEDRTRRQDYESDQDRALRELSAGEAGNPSAILERLANGGLDPAIISQLAQSIAARPQQQSGGAEAPTLSPEVLQAILNSVGGAQ